MVGPTTYYEGSFTLFKRHGDFEYRTVQTSDEVPEAFSGTKMFNKARGAQIAMISAVMFLTLALVMTTASAFAKQQRCKWLIMLLYLLVTAALVTGWSLWLSLFSNMTKEIPNDDYIYDLYPEIINNARTAMKLADGPTYAIAATAVNVVGMVMNVVLLHTISASKNEIKESFIP